MNAALPLVALLIAATPLWAQSDDRLEALGAALEYALKESRFADSPASVLLLDTVRAGVSPSEAARLARDFGLTAGRSEEHCSRFALDGRWSRQQRQLSPVGLRVHGANAIITAWFAAFAPDSAYIWVSVVSGDGPHLNGPGSYVLRNDSAGWHASPHLRASGGHCRPRFFTAPLALAARAVLDELEAPGPICLDPTGFPLLESDSLAAVLGAEISGRWVPEVEGETPEPYRDPCAKADTPWGGIVRYLHVDWESDDLIRVTVEGRRVAGPGDANRRSIRYTLRNQDGRWVVVGKGEVPAEGADQRPVPDDPVATGSRDRSPARLLVAAGLY